MSNTLSNITCLQCSSAKPELIQVFDDPSKGFAYNVFWCDHCGTLYREDVWKNAGVTILAQNGDIIHKTRKEVIAESAVWVPA